MLLVFSTTTKAGNTDHSGLLFNMTVKHTSSLCLKYQIRKSLQAFLLIFVLLEITIWPFHFSTLECSLPLPNGSDVSVLILCFHTDTPGCICGSPVEDSHPGPLSMETGLGRGFGLGEIVDWVTANSDSNVCRMAIIRRYKVSWVTHSIFWGTHVTK